MGVWRTFLRLEDGRQTHRGGRRSSCTGQTLRRCRTLSGSARRGIEVVDLQIHLAWRGTMARPRIGARRELGSRSKEAGQKRAWKSAKVSIWSRSAGVSKPPISSAMESPSGKPPRATSKHSRTAKHGATTSTLHNGEPRWRATPTHSSAICQCRSSSERTSFAYSNPSGSRRPRPRAVCEAGSKPFSTGALLGVSEP